MQSFEDYLKQHNLEALTVALQARVRYMTVYNAIKGRPITPQHAEQLREVVLRMTGIPFQGSFVLIAPPFHEFPTFPMRSIPRHSSS